jgi:hypothetical protein
MYCVGKPRDSPSQERETNGIRANEGHEDESIDERAECPLDPRLKTGGCARSLYQTAIR